MSCIVPSTKKQTFSNWRTFAAVGGASLAAATNADAGIVYSGVIDKTISIPNGSSGFASTRFKINGRSLAVSMANFTTPSNGLVNAFAGLGVVRTGPPGTGLPPVWFGLTSKFFNAPKYSFGQAIKPLATFASGVGLVKEGSYATFVPPGQFQPGNVSGFVGFNTINGDRGWIQVSVENNNTLAGVSGLVSSVTIISYAYNDIPGGDIYAGQGIPTPEPATMALALLAAGATGLAALRKAKAKLAS